jgi:GT2 family glycosyltransferase
MFKIATVVVTFNRYELLRECLDSLLSQTYKTDIILIDNNSTDNTPQKLQQDGYLSEQNSILFKKLPKNEGGAGGFYEGVKIAMQEEYDYIWLMDDDAEPALNALEILIDNLQEKYSAYAPAIYTGTEDNHEINIAGHRGYFDFDNPLPMLQKPISKELYSEKYVEIDMASFVGILIPTLHVKKIGLPKKEFFIHYDDTEYCLRLSQFGKILMVTDSKIYHKDKRQEEKYTKKILWFEKTRVRYDKLWIKYFGVRNAIYLATRYGNSKISVYIVILKNYMMLLKDIILYDDKKLTRIKFATSSYIDGIKGVFDNEQPSRILK